MNSENDAHHHENGHRNDFCNTLSTSQLGGVQQKKIMMLMLVKTGKNVLGIEMKWNLILDQHLYKAVVGVAWAFDWRVMGMFHALKIYRAVEYVAYGDDHEKTSIGKEQEVVKVPDLAAQAHGPTGQGYEACFSRSTTIVPLDRVVCPSMSPPNHEKEEVFSLKLAGQSGSFGE